MLWLTGGNFSLPVFAVPEWPGFEIGKSHGWGEARRGEKQFTLWLTPDATTGKALIPQFSTRKLGEADSKAK